MRILIVINPGAGNYKAEHVGLITEYLQATQHDFIFFARKKFAGPEELKQEIARYSPDRVVAVGGDGTINYVASCLLYSQIPLAILPTGSANGLANELLIPDFGRKALLLALTGEPRSMHVTKINDNICLHLSDIGLNAQMIKSFESGMHRGKSGYFFAAWQVFFHRQKMRVTIQSVTGEVTHDAFMIVIANATTYGTGAVVNPKGKINDGIFELIVFDRLSFLEIGKMLFTNLALNPRIIQMYHGSGFRLFARDKVHLQVDGEYIGKVNSINTLLCRDAINIIAPKGPIGCF